MVMAMIPPTVTVVKAARSRWAFVVILTQLSCGLITTHPCYRPDDLNAGKPSTTFTPTGKTTSSTTSNIHFVLSGSGIVSFIQFPLSEALVGADILSLHFTSHHYWGERMLWMESGLHGKLSPAMSR